jgi:hypothetical protein
MFDKNDKKKTITPIQKRMQYLRDKHIRKRGNNLNIVIDTTKLYYNFTIFDNLCQKQHKTCINANLCYDRYQLFFLKKIINTHIEDYQ